MKIALISRGRTRSTAILQSLSDEHKLENFNENYFRPHAIIKQRLSLKKNSSYGEHIDFFKRKIKETTNEYFRNENFCCKIFPSMLVLPLHVIPDSENLDTTKTRILFNIEEYLQISQYDSIYFLDRNLNDSALSWIYTRKTGKYHTFENDNITYDPVNLVDEDYERAKFYVLEYILQQKIKEYLVKKEIKFTEISDINYKNFTNENNSIGIQERFIEYDKLINGCSTLTDLITKTYKKYTEQTENWIFI
jgi:hypothetical protein